ncbi:unnamed protein product [Parnassius apollo]|uniref:(apollo) hypothetical protein n=1 Tax=Parnassius apollo TaxID=110799 RepID=A0A8S3XM86_PARAO|nr:unnamed protein product [Parnassius apollo]
MCKQVFLINSEDHNDKEQVNLNIAATTGIVASGIGFSQFEELCSAMDIPVFSSKYYSKLEDEVFEKWKKTASVSMEAAAQMEKDIAIAEGRTKNSIPELESERTVSDILEKTTMKEAVFSLAESWNQLNANLINKSWLPLWPQLNVEKHTDDDFEPEDEVPLAFFVNRGFSEAAINDFLLGNDDLNETEPLTDDEIIRQVTQECDGESEEISHVEPVASVSNSSAVSALNTCLEWADQVDIPLPEKMLLRKLRDKAFYLSLNTSRQTKILDFFKKV